MPFGADLINGLLCVCYQECHGRRVRTRAKKTYIISYGGGVASDRVRDKNTDWKPQQLYV